jgi:hypothetical protein
MSRDFAAARLLPPLPEGEHRADNSKYGCMGCTVLVLAFSLVTAAKANYIENLSFDGYASKREGT